MSAETIKAIGDAITAHAQDLGELDDHGLVTAWVIAYESTHPGSESDVAFGANYAHSDASPAATAGLARWVGRQVEADAMPLVDYDEEDDE